MRIRNNSTGEKQFCPEVTNAKRISKPPFTPNLPRIILYNIQFIDEYEITFLKINRLIFLNSCYK